MESSSLRGLEVVVVEEVASNFLAAVKSHHPQVELVFFSGFRV